MDDHDKVSTGTFFIGLVIGLIGMAFTWAFSSDHYKSVGFTEGQQSVVTLIPEKIDETRQLAVKAGVAYYELNPETGKIEFKYVDIRRVVASVIQQMQHGTPNEAGVLQ